MATGNFLLLGGIIALTVPSVLSIAWPTSAPDGIETDGSKSNMDSAKVAAYKVMHKINFNGINNTVAKSYCPLFSPGVVGNVELKENDIPFV
ncbi:hypothetical protein HJC23_005992 [Cyclotella cryptica]|uniref:Uncharacterized protein n=1 Tax=Cyclotella cryptica TaxID=29204 RepID=A0ABD3NT96_9STRA